MTMTRENIAQWVEENSSIWQINSTEDMIDLLVKFDQYSKQSLHNIKDRLTDIEISEIAEKEVPYSNNSFGEGSYTQGKRIGFEDGMEYYRDNCL